MALVNCDPFAHYATAQAGTISIGAFGRDGEVHLVGALVDEEIALWVRRRAVLKARIIAMLAEVNRTDVERLR